MKKLIIFDLDGTLLDTSQGIIHCYRKTGELLTLEKNTVDNENCVIGGPLSDGFKKLYKIESKEQLEKAVITYRELYKAEGIKLFKSYNGIKEMLNTLKTNGYLLAVATLKLEGYAKQMLSDAGLSQFFDIIYGWDATDRCTKAVIINRALNTLNVSSTDALLVGDSAYDEKGATATNTDFLGVSYGFGINNSSSYPFPVVNSPENISDYIMNIIQK